MGQTVKTIYGYSEIANQTYTSSTASQLWPLDVTADGRKLLTLAVGGTNPGIRFIDFKNPIKKTLLSLSNTATPNKTYYYGVVSDDGQTVVVTAVKGPFTPPPIDVDVEIYQYDGEDWQLTRTINLPSTSTPSIGGASGIYLTPDAGFLSIGYGDTSSGTQFVPTVEIYSRSGVTWNLEDTITRTSSTGTSNGYVFSALDPNATQLYMLYQSTPGGGTEIAYYTLAGGTATFQNVNVANPARNLYQRDNKVFWSYTAGGSIGGVIKEVGGTSTGTIRNLYTSSAGYDFRDAAFSQGESHISRNGQYLVGLYTDGLSPPSTSTQYVYSFTPSATIQWPASVNESSTVLTVPFSTRRIRNVVVSNSGVVFVGGETAFTSGVGQISTFQL